MKVLVDTCVWSLALRRHKVNKSDLINQLEDLILDQRVQIIGAIRQELLSGIKNQKQFYKLKNYLRSFPDLVLDENDYELAANFYISCRNNGIQGSNTDFLICAVAVNRGMKIFTSDKDFEQFRKIINISLY